MPIYCDCRPHGIGWATVRAPATCEARKPVLTPTRRTIRRFRLRRRRSRCSATANQLEEPK